MPAINAAALGKLFSKGGPGEQLLIYGLLQQLLQAVLAPELAELTRGVNEIIQSTPLSPAELAVMVVRHIVSEQDAEAYAKQSGIAPSDFVRMVHSAGQGLAPGELAEALRRGLIPEQGTGPSSVSFEQGIAESDLREKWADIVKQLSVNEPTPGDALNALLQGQLERGQAEDLYKRFGGDMEHFDWLFRSHGSAPTPVELTSMAQRGIIPWEGDDPTAASFHQGFLQGPWRDLWEEPYRQLGEYHPPARTIVAMVRSGALSDEQAVGFFKGLGMSQELAEASLRDAHHQKLAAAKELAKGDVETLYREQVITAADAGTMLKALDYTDQEIAWLLQMQDLKRAVGFVNSAIGRVHTLYVNRKIDKATVVGALDKLSVPPRQRDDLLATWDVERTTNVKVLTAAEIASAFHYKVMDQATAQSELVAIGYTPFDAWVLLSIREHAVLPDQPPRGPSA